MSLWTSLDYKGDGGRENFIRHMAENSVIKEGITNI